MLPPTVTSEIAPTRFLKDRSVTLQDGNECRPSLIILHQPIADIQVLSRVWEHTRYRLCADGGANQLFDLFIDTPELRSTFVRDVVMHRHVSMLIQLTFSSRALSMVTLTRYETMFNNTTATKESKYQKTLTSTAPTSAKESTKC